MQEFSVNPVSNRVTMEGYLDLNPQESVNVSKGIEELLDP